MHIKFHSFLFSFPINLSIQCQLVKGALINSEHGFSFFFSPRPVPVVNSSFFFRRKRSPRLKCMQRKYIDRSGHRRLCKSIEVSLFVPIQNKFLVRRGRISLWTFERRHFRFWCSKKITMTKK